MSAAPKARVEEVRSIVHDVLGSSTSKSFLVRVDTVLNDWAEGKIGAAIACDKVKKMVGLFIDEGKARQIGDRCATIVMKETAAQKE